MEIIVQLSMYLFFIYIVYKLTDSKSYKQEENKEKCDNIPDTIIID